MHHNRTSDKGKLMMRTALISVFLAAACCTVSCIVSAQQTVIVVRHGEKFDNSADPVLSPAGDRKSTRLNSSHQ